MGRKVIFCDWQSAPHLTDEQKVKQLEGMDPHLRDARTRGIPYLGSGSIYPVETSAIEVKPFDIPNHWPRGFGLDVGWNRTAAIWGALNKESDVLYLYDEHYGAQDTPAVHAHAIMGYGRKGNLRAPWIKGVIDPASKGKSQHDGVMLLKAYRDLGLDLEMADNAVEAGIHEVWLRLSSGRLKVFSHLANFWKEYLLYRRNKDGKIMKKFDHLVDALRYLTLSGLPLMRPVPFPQASAFDSGSLAHSGQGWMAG